MIQTTWYERKSPDLVQVRPVRSLAYPYYHIIVIKLLLLYTTLRHVLTEGSDRQIVTIIPCFYTMDVATAYDFVADIIATSHRIM